MRLETVFSFVVSRENYTASAWILDCMDDRWSREKLSLDNTRNYLFRDYHRVPGSAKVLAEEGSRRDDALESLSLSVEKHGTKLVILRMHLDCGAYGGSQTFEHDDDFEMSHHVDVLQRAGNVVRGRFPSVKIELELWTFEGALAMPFEEAQSAETPAVVAAVVG